MLSTRKMHYDRILCPHCSSELSKKTLMQHKRLYYDASTETWIKRRNVAAESDDMSSVCGMKV